ncbi:MAG: hypothetical protein CK539_06580 [Flavobacteriales bacterium]|nr:MAG: hypothetical protein CK539_06580 [Flavobacteriales bacterium]
MNLDWFRQHMLACPFKYITGYDCPGCGLQRSFIELLNGNIRECFSLYPPLFPIIILVIILIFQLKFRKPFGSKILIGLIIFSSLVIVISYILKQVYFHSHL